MEEADELKEHGLVVTLTVPDTFPDNGLPEWVAVIEEPRKRGMLASDLSDADIPERIWQEMEAAYDKHFKEQREGRPACPCVH